MKITPEQLIAAEATAFGFFRMPFAEQPKWMQAGWQAIADALNAGFPDTFQERVGPWIATTFTPVICADMLERGDRFLEEAIELLQANDYPRERISALTNYVYDRPQGEINQEVGGVMVTLAAYCLALGVDMHEAGETELARVWTMVDKIRTKQAAKPTGSALPVALNAGRPDTDAADLATAREVLAAMDAKVAGLEAERDRLRKALEWYAGQGANCRRITDEGREACNNLDADGGKRARAALDAAR